MSLERFDELAYEHEQLVVGPLIYGEIERAVLPLLNRRNPGILFTRSVDAWDASLREEIVIEFAEYLLSGRLQQAFAHAHDDAHLAAILRMRARQFLDNRVLRSEAENLTKRAVELLETDGTFVREGNGSLRRWGCESGPQAPCLLSDQELRTLARGLPVPVSLGRLRRDTQITSRVISNPELRELIQEALRRAKGSLTRGQVRMVLEERLGLRPAETISISRRIGERPPLEDLIPREPDELEEREAWIIADDLVAQLSVRQLRVLFARFELGLSRDQTAEHVGIAHGTVDAEMARIRDLLLSACDDDLRLARRVLRLIVEPESE